MFIAIRLFVGVLLGFYLWYDALSSGGYISIDGLIGAAFSFSFFLLVFAFFAAFAPADIITEMFGEPPIVSVGFAIFTAACMIVLGIITSFPTPMSMDFSLGAALYGIAIWLPSIFVGFILVLFVPFLIGIAFVSVIPMSVFGVIALCTKSTSQQIMQHHAKNRMPNDEIERRLAEAMESELTSDQEIVDLLYQLPMLSRLWHTFIYKVKTKKFSEIAKVLKAQEDKIREQTKAARAAHQYERAKRDHQS
ncbi:hypothetical protein [Roseovarius aestuarii]|uniref:Uncharacterized protein n=1 Tax=Roseovarius aestuarii TaxID=475083 RepID=A0A1X7BQH3_9RHOB|nr:hypothetical protein [Roseovarius aestuarii]SMC11824.1 hypothetical protein ROA7745_01643 [Roseovarius aestuarii]